MPEAVKTCFVIGPIGEPFSDVYHRALTLLERVIAPAVAALGYAVVRADQIPTTGMVHLQIAAQLIQADLVIADLTGANANVFYELGGRHALGKPCIQVLLVGERLPFDVAPMRTIMIDDRTPAGMQTGIDAIQAQVRTLSTPLLTPMSVLVNVTATPRDGALLAAASSIGTLGPVEPRRPPIGVPRSPHEVEEHAAFWDSLLAFDEAGGPPQISAVVTALVNRIMTRPTSALRLADGVYVVRSRPALIEGMTVPALKLAYAFDNNIITLLSLEPAEPLDGDDGGHEA